MIRDVTITASDASPDPLKEVARLLDLATGEDRLTVLLPLADAQRLFDMAHRSVFMRAEFPPRADRSEVERLRKEVADLRIWHAAIQADRDRLQRCFDHLMKETGSGEVLRDVINAATAATRSVPPRRATLTVYAQPDFPDDNEGTDV